MLDRKFITKNIKEIGKKRLEKLGESQKKQIKKEPRKDRELLRLKLMSRKREVRTFVKILNRFFNSTQEFKANPLADKDIQVVMKERLSKKR